MLCLVAIIAAALWVPAHAADVQAITARVAGIHYGDALTAMDDCNPAASGVSRDATRRGCVSPHATPDR